MNKIVNIFFIYVLIRKLVTPFKKTAAYKLGIIDENGNVLRKRKTLTTKEEKDAYTILDTLIFNIKKLITRTQAGKGRLATFNTGLALIKESVTDDIECDIEDSDFEKFVKNLDLTDEEREEIRKKQYKRRSEHEIIDEEIVNAVGDGTALAMDIPVVHLKKKRINTMYLNRFKPTNVGFKPKTLKTFLDSKE